MKGYEAIFTRVVVGGGRLTPRVVCAHGPKTKKTLSWPRTIETKNYIANIVVFFHVVSTV